MDRNGKKGSGKSTTLTSLSARRAWIEILCLRLMFWLFLVALRKESVDRNDPLKTFIILPKVALRKESVDRNTVSLILPLFGVLSLSARRAWIEILNVEILSALACVALRKESVDRNFAWLTPPATLYVALRKESVDRNSRCNQTYPRDGSRSPQGERG